MALEIEVSTEKRNAIIDWLQEKKAKQVSRKITNAVRHKVETLVYDVGGEEIIIWSYPVYRHDVSLSEKITQELEQAGIIPKEAEVTES